jgi:hypothetical protein
VSSYFNVCGDLQGVAITKSDPNWTFYLHEYFYILQ